MLGYPSEAVTLPCNGAESSATDMNNDIRAIREVLQSLADEGKQMVVIMHSYGGYPGSCAVEGFSSNIIAMTYMTSVAAPKGKSAVDILGEDLMPFSRLMNDRWYFDEEVIAETFYGDLSQEQQQAAVAQLHEHISPGAFRIPATYEPWHDIPCMYIFATEDKAIPLAAQQGSASMLGEYIPYTITSSHSPMLSRPEEVVEAIELIVTTVLRKKDVLR